MNNLTNEEWFENIFKTQEHQVEIKTLINLKGHQSIQLILPCGCIQVDQYQPDLINKETDLKTLLNDDNRQQYFQFCKNHNYEHNNNSW